MLFRITVLVDQYMYKLSFFFFLSQNWSLGSWKRKNCSYYQENSLPCQVQFHWFESWWDEEDPINKMWQDSGRQICVSKEHHDDVSTIYRYLNYLTLLLWCQFRHDQVCVEVGFHQHTSLHCRRFPWVHKLSLLAQDRVDWPLFCLRKSGWGGGGGRRREKNFLPLPLPLPLLASPQLPRTPFRLLWVQIQDGTHLIKMNVFACQNMPALQATSTQAYA